MSCPAGYTLSGRTCNFSDTTLYTCPQTVRVNNIDHYIYKFTPKYDSTSGKVVCEMETTLPQSSIWGQDGDLDNLPSDCTDITDTRCQLPPALVDRLKTNYAGTMSVRLAPIGGSGKSEGASTGPDAITCPAGFLCAKNINIDGSFTIASITPCSGGYFCPVNTFVDCPWYGASRTYVCQGSLTGLNCPAGYYCPGESNPQPCPSTGTTGCTAGRTGPVACAAATGKFCPAGSTAQSDCPAGYYCTTSAVKVPCPFGKYSSSTNQTSDTACQNCLAGYYCSTGSSSPTQNQCTPGNYCPEGTGLQKQCPEGHYCSDPAVNPPYKCPTGVQCPAGTATYYGLTCTGKQRPNSTYTSCMSCQPPPPGSIYKDASGCDIIRCTGRTQPNAAQTSCDACPTPKAGYIRGSAQGCSEIQCPIGMVPNSTWTTCKPV